jgi:hypothetical protein
MMSEDIVITKQHSAPEGYNYKCLLNGIFSRFSGHTVNSILLSLEFLSHLTVEEESTPEEGSRLVDAEC